MKKLNEQGWGLSVFIAFLGVFFLAIIMIVYVSNKYDVGIENINTNSTSEKVTSTLQDTYEKYEKEIKEKAIIYQESHHPNLSNNETFYTSIGNLNISSNIKEECSGYVEFKKENDTYYYSPYISCGLYRTKGYNSNFNK